MFADTAKIEVKAGDGGRGIVSFRTEKYEDRGGPDGGDGGRGGNIVFEAQTNQNTLARFRHTMQIRADNGRAGDKQRMRGRGADDVVVPVPVGTLITDDDGNQFDFTEPGQTAVVALGGDGGFGNAHFKSSTRRTPRIAELGVPGEQKTLQLELKLVADVGLVGLPNAGKSTFLSVVSNAKPKIASYPFTTLVPQLGVVESHGLSLVIADIPGLIAGANEGKGLGDDFLRHVERTEVLLHLIDVNDPDPTESYQTIRKELDAWRQLADKPVIIALTKTETVDESKLSEVRSSLTKAIGKGAQLYELSSQTHQGVEPVLFALADQIDTAKRLADEAEDEQSDQPALYELSAREQRQAWQVVKADDNKLKVRGKKIEKFALKTDPTNTSSVRRLFDIMHKMGIMHQLIRDGYQTGMSVEIAGKQFNQ